LENESYLADIWNQRLALDIEAFDRVEGIFSEKIPLTWNTYLDFVISKESPMRKGFLFSATIKDAVFIQNTAYQMLKTNPQVDAYSFFNVIYSDEGHQTHGKKLSGLQSADLIKQLGNVSAYKRLLDPYMGNLKLIYDQVLLVDLMRLMVDAERFSPELLSVVGDQSLVDYKQITAAFVGIHEVVRKMAKELFHEIDFKEWRKSNEKEFLKKKREEEKLTRRYAKPYIDYLDAVENELFKDFWFMHRWNFMAAFLTNTIPFSIEDEKGLYLEHLRSWYQEIEQGAHQEIEWANAYHILKGAIKNYSSKLAIEYLQTMRSFQELDRPVLGKYRALRNSAGQVQLEKHLATAFYPKFGYGYGRSQAYRQAATQGSIFKLITAYEALIQRFQTLQDEGKSLADLNPFEMVDAVHYKGKDLYVGYTMNGQSYPRHYKKGRLPRSANPNNGTLDIIKALELSSNPYFSLIAGEVLKSPNDLADAARKFSYGSKTGIDLPGEIAGKIPDDLEFNRTGLYSMAIGQHTLVVTPLQTALMLSALANGGKILKPKIIEMMVGKEPQRGRSLVADNQIFPYQESLQLAGIDFPLFIVADAEQQKSLIKSIPTEVTKTVFLPDAVRRILLDGMCRVVAKTHSESLSSLHRMYKKYPEAVHDYIDFKYQLMGKTSTSESTEVIDLDFEKGTNLYTHVWFGGIVYDHDVLDKNEKRFVFRNSFGSPELVVVVYLRYGGYGKESAPIAAQIAKKWREIKLKHKK